MKKILIIVLFGLFISNCGGGSSGGGSSNPTPSTSNSNNTINRSFSSSGNTLSITNIAKPASQNDVFYYGRFIYKPDGIRYFTGSMKFKLNQNDATTAYFSDCTLEHYSRVTGIGTSENIVTSPVDMAVSNSYSETQNHVFVSNATSRFVDFDLDFGNNTYFPDVHNGGVIFSADFSTMVGGNNRTFIFIAQQASSQPDINTNALLGNWNSLLFTVNSAGVINLTTTSSIHVGGTGGNGYIAFTGVNSSIGNFDGEVALVDPTSGAFMFGYGSGSGTPTAHEVDGAFLVSADETLAVGYDALNQRYFAVER